MSHIELRGQGLDYCKGCGGVWIPRTGILALRGAEGSDHPALRAATPSGAGPDRDLDCPSCHRRLASFRYRGGKVLVERCPSCDHVFLDRGELRAVLDEWREGFEISDGARTALAASHAQTAARISAGKTAGGVAALVVALVIAAYVLEELWWWEVEGLVWYIAAPGAAVVAALFFMGRRRRRQEAEAMHHMGKAERVLEAGSQRAAEKPPAAKQEGSRCPWCRAKVPEGATHCDQCDSDII